MIIAALVVVSGSAAAVRAQIVRIDEAERCKYVCKHKDPGATIWASGGAVVPPFWGFEPGESVEWPVSLSGSQQNLKLAVRYSYAAEHYRNFHHTENPNRKLHLIIDGHKDKPILIPVPNTGWWDIFETACVDLPKLSSGRHIFKIVSPEPHMTTNLDCFILLRGGAEKIPPGLRSTTIARSAPASAPAGAADPTRFVIRVTPRAPAMLKIKPEAILKQFDRIYAFYADFMGWTPPPFGINIIEDDKWPDPGATAFQNNYGVHFRAGVMHAEQGNWCHEMVHMFYVAHFPRWFDESSVRTLTIFNCYPALYPKGTRPQEDALYKQCEAEARRFLAGTESTGDVAVVQYAVRVKYGPDVFRKFFHLCAAAGRKAGSDGAKELDFTPGRHLTKAEIVKYMSLAAGENVLPLYQRWTGFHEVP